MDNTTVQSYSDPHTHLCASLTPTSSHKLEDLTVDFRPFRGIQPTEIIHMHNLSYITHLFTFTHNCLSSCMTPMDAISVILMTLRCTDSSLLPRVDTQYYFLLSLWQPLLSGKSKDYHTNGSSKTRRLLSMTEKHFSQDRRKAD